MEYLSSKILRVHIRSTYFILCPTRIYNFPNASKSRQKAREKNRLKQLRFSRQRWITKAVALSHVTLGRATLARDLWKTRSLRIGTRHSCGTRAGLFSRRKAARCTYRRKITKPTQVLKTSRPPLPRVRRYISRPVSPFRRSSPLAVVGVPMPRRGCTMTLGYDISDVSHTVYGSTSSMSDDARGHPSNNFSEK